MENQTPENDLLQKDSDEAQAQRIANGIKGTFEYLRQNKAIEILTYVVGTVAALYVASYLLDAAAATVTSYKKLDKAWKQ